MNTGERNVSGRGTKGGMSVQEQEMRVAGDKG